LPGSVSTGLYVDLPETLCIYGVIVALLIFFLAKAPRTLWVAFGLMILLMGSFIYNKVQHQSAKCWTVYSVNKNTAMDFVSGERRVLIADLNFLKDGHRIDFHTGGWMDHLGVDTYAGVEIIRGELMNSEMQLIKREGFVEFCHKRILLVKEPIPEEISIAVDYIVIYGNPKHSMAELLNGLHPKLVIVDASNQSFRIKGWKEECRRMNQACWSTADSGAFILYF
jgi:energy-coupling factor transporter transmembrane protein EcfT